MNGEDLKAGLARLAEPVVPAGNPYARLLARRTCHRRARASLAGAVLMAGALVAGTGLLPGWVSSSPPRPPRPAPAPPGEVDSALVEQLLDSPVRGNLAGDLRLMGDIGSGYDAARDELLVAPGLDQVRVLFAHDIPGARVVVVAFRSHSKAVIRVGVAGSGASVRQLLDKTGTPDVYQELSPYVTMMRTEPDGGVTFNLGLAPSGCIAETSVAGRIQRNGTVRRQWLMEQTDGFLVRGPGAPGERWRFICAGKVRYEGPSDRDSFNMVKTPTGTPGGTGSSPGAGAPSTKAVVEDASARLAAMLHGGGLETAAVESPWTGFLLDPDLGGQVPVVLVSSCGVDGGCAGLIQVGTAEQRYRWASTRDGTGWPTWRVVTGSDAVLAAPVPVRDGRYRTLVVVAGSPAVRVDVLDAGGRRLSTRSVTNGTATLVVADLARAATIRTFAADGAPVATSPFRLASDGLGEPVIWEW